MVFHISFHLGLYSRDKITNKRAKYQMKVQKLSFLCPSGRTPLAPEHQQERKNLGAAKITNKRAKHKNLRLIFCTSNEKRVHAVKFTNCPKPFHELFAKPFQNLIPLHSENQTRPLPTSPQGRSQKLKFKLKQNLQTKFTNT